MAINREGTEEFLIATDAKSIFHFSYVDKNLICTTGQPYIAVSKAGLSKNSKEDDVVNRLFNNPERGEDGFYDYNNLSPKDELSILNEVEIKKI